MSAMNHILLDTDFLLTIAKERIDLFEELRRLCSFLYDVCVFEATLQELERITQRGGRDARAAVLALQLLRGKVRILEGTGYADDLLAARADEHHLVATLDKALKRRIPGRKISIKQEKYLVFVP